MRELELVVADGSVVAYSREADAAVWDGVVTSLGCHGVVTRVTLDLVPDYDVHTFGYSAVPAEHFLDHFDEMLTDPACTSFNAMVRPSHRREFCHSAAPPSTFIRCFNMDKRGVSAK